MTELTRRDFLKQASLGLAATGVARLVLRAEATPTAASKNIEISETVLQQMGEPPVPIMMQDNIKPTQKSQLGPFYRAGAPFRAKVTPPFEPGTVLIVAGRVWGHDTKKPLSGAVLDVWHEGDPKHDIDPLFQTALMTKIAKQQVNGQTYESAIFDIVLEAGNGMQGD